MHKLTPLKSALVQLFFLCTFSLSAQIITNDYVFSQQLDFYYEIDGGETSQLGTDWLEIESDFAVLTPFNFNVYGKPVYGLTSYFTPSLLYFVPQDESDTELPFLMPFGSPLLQNRAMIPGSNQVSDISTVVDGEIGERIMKIQYRNAGFANEVATMGTANDYINFQLWLYEATNAIEIHYGNYLVTNDVIAFNGATGPSFGLFMIEETDFDEGDPNTAIFLENDPMSPDLMRETENVDERSLSGMPPTGMIYTFTPVLDTTEIVNGTEIIWLESIDVFPNPTVDVLQIKVQNQQLIGATYALTDVNGKLITKGNAQENAEINLQGLPAGTYFLKMQKENAGIVKRIVKL
jgi:hypothetical protein